jgi:hypothetical protein
MKSKLNKIDYPFIFVAISLPLPILQAYLERSLHIYFIITILILTLFSGKRIITTMGLLYCLLLIIHLIVSTYFLRINIYLYMIPIYGIYFSLFYRNSFNIDFIYKTHIIYIICEMIILRYDSSIFEILVNPAGVQGFVNLHNRTLDGIGNNGLILGPQAASLISLLSALWFLKPYDGQTNIKWFIISILCAILSPTMTVNSLIILSFIIIITTRTKFSKNYKHLASIALLIISPIIMTFMFSFIMTKFWFDHYFNNFFGFIQKTDFIDLMFIGDIKFTEIGFVNILNHFSIIEVIILFIIPYLLMTNKINKSKKNHNIIMLISIFSTIHYLPIFSIHFVQILSYHLSFLIRTPDVSKNYGRKLLN